jgi:hypothetical protein
VLVFVDGGHGSFLSCPRSAASTRFLPITKLQLQCGREEIE